ncbi:MmcB family DNA repair protein [Alkalicaulis satelles]|nr:MmcB family DNA repair protein [Alkalicaulis satelles]
MTSKSASSESLRDSLPATAADVLQVIEDAYCRSDRYILLREFPLQPGERGHSKHRIDGLLVRTQTGRPDELTAIEVKVSRKDFERELADPEKRARAMRFANSFYFAVPAGLISGDEVPDDCGLFWTSKNAAPCIIKGAPLNLTPEPPSKDMIRDLVRAAHRKGLVDASQDHRLTAWPEIELMGESLAELSKSFFRDDPEFDNIKYVLDIVIRQLHRQGRPAEAAEIRKRLNAARANVGKFLVNPEQSD